MSEHPPEMMAEYGADPQSLRTDVQRMDLGTGVWVNGTPGMQLDKGQHRTRYGNGWRVEIRLLAADGRSVVIGSVEFGPDGRKLGHEVGNYYAAVQAKLVGDDPQVRYFIDSTLVRCLPTIDYVEHLRQYPVQFARVGGVVLCPGDEYDVARNGTLTKIERLGTTPQPAAVAESPAVFTLARSKPMRLSWWREAWNWLAWQLGL